MTNGVVLWPTTSCCCSLTERSLLRTINNRMNNLGPKRERAAMR